MRDEPLPAAPPTDGVVGRGSEAMVHLDRARRSVTKVYRSADFEAARRAAVREYRILGQVHDALREVPGIACPKPIAMHETPPGVCMEFRDGLPLARHLSRRRLRADEIARLAQALAHGLRVYVLATGEAYYDFSLQNTLIDTSTGGLVLIDFGIPQAQLSLHGRHDAMPMSVGNFLGWSLYELARPANLPAWLARAQHLQLYVAMRDALLDSGALAATDLPEVESIARGTYDNLTASGPAQRRGWYRVSGALWLTWALARARRELKSGGRSPCAKSIYAK
jgi:hypothetical protein